MHRGYIKLFRKVEDSAVWLDEGLLKVWVWCLLRANWKERMVPIKVGKKVFQVPVQPGQFVYGRQAASLELNMPQSTVRNRMTRLAVLGNVDIKSDSNYSVVTICNWKTYAECENAEGQLVGQVEDKYRTQRRKDKKEEEEELAHTTNGNAGKNIPPTVTEVTAYCAERNNGIDAEHFVDYYQTRGWILNKGVKMKDWHGAIRTWEKNGNQHSLFKSEPADRNYLDG